MKSVKMESALLMYGKPGDNQIFSESFDVFDCSSAESKVIRLCVPTLKEAQELASTCIGKRRIVIVKNIKEGKIIRIQDNS